MHYTTLGHAILLYSWEPPQKIKLLKLLKASEVFMFRNALFPAAFCALACPGFTQGKCIICYNNVHRIIYIIYTTINVYILQCFIFPKKRTCERAQCGRDERSANQESHPEKSDLLREDAQEYTILDHAIL